MLRTIGTQHRCRIAWSIFAVFISLWLTHFASAAEDCAGTPQAIIQYLNKAETQSTPYRIKVLAGVYLLTGSKYQWNIPVTMTLEGGYVDCNTRGSSAATATVIDSSALPRGIELAVSPGDLNVDGFTFQGGDVTVFDAGGAISPGNLYVTHTRATQTSVVFATKDGATTLDDVLIDHAPPDAVSHCSVVFSMYGDSNSWVWKFVTIHTNQNEDVCLASHASPRNNAGRIYDSIIWPGNVRFDIGGGWTADDIFDLKLISSLFTQVVKPYGTSTEEASIHTDPLWVNPGAGNYKLQVPPSSISPAINTGAGAAQVPGGISASDTDIEGSIRVIGSAPDMGAYESSVDDGALFAVTTSDDCATPLNLPSCGSLRDAIARATAPTSTAPVKTIRFWIIDWMNQPICPAIINVGSSLPDITTSIVIDGFSQGSINEIDPPLSWPNIDPYVFNASLCLNIVGPGSGVAFRVPSGSNGSLTLRGVGLGGFTQGVMLLGGANHQIAGNQFGGITSNGVNLQGFTVQAVNVSPAVQPSGALIIGGDNPADRNVFLNAFSGVGVGAKAIFIGPGTISDPDHCQIDGNLVGILPDGTYAQGNDYGMMLDGDGCTIRNNWIAGSHKGAIWVQGMHYVLQSNVIGLAPRSFQQQINGGFGIEISGSNNIVGASASDVAPVTIFDRGLGNYIQDTDYNGIVVEGSGTGNSIRGNWIINSGVGSGLLALDLGKDGPTANDVGDMDAGPDGLQNFPDPFGLSWTTPPQTGATNDATVSVVLTTPPGPISYNVDVYLGEGCDATGRGIPELWIGRYSADVAAGATTSKFQIPVKIPDYFDPALAAVSLTATNVTDHNTSEVGNCLSIDTIFTNGLDP